MADLDLGPVFYTLNEKHEVVPVERSKWGAISVAEDNVGPYRISTMFTGTSFTDPPLLFETMVFRLDEPERKRMCATWAEAEAQHRAMVEEIKARASDEL